MTMLINHNLFAKNMAGLYNKTTNALQKSLSKLSSGLRVSVTDFNDASGMEIAQQMASKLNGYSKAMAGGQDGISLLQTAEGALTEVDAMLVRMRELANQAANDTLTGQDRAYIQAEIDQLRTEIDRVGNTTHFNNKKLLNGNAAALWSAIPKETQAIIKGSLNSIDQFGQKVKTEGNYNIKLMAAPPGEAEVQKTKIFTSHVETGWYAKTAEDKGVAPASEQTLPDIEVEGGYNIDVVVTDVLDSGRLPRRGSASLVYKSNDNSGTLSAVGSSRLSNIANNANLKFTVASSDSNSVTLNYSGTVIDKSGSNSDFSGSVTISGTGTSVVNFGSSGSSVAMAAGNYDSFNAGDEFVYNIQANAADGDIVMKVSGDIENGNIGDYYYVLNPSTSSNKTLELAITYKDETGALKDGTVYLATESNFSTDLKTGKIATFQKGDAAELEKDYGTSWHVSTLPSVASAEIENLSGGTYSVTSTVRGSNGNPAGDWSVIQSFDSSGKLKSSNAAISDLGLSFANPNRIYASGVLALTIKDATAGGAVTVSDAKFIGVANDYTEINGGSVKINDASIDSTSGTSILGNNALSVNGYTIGNLVGNGNALSTAINNGNLAAGDKIYIEVQGSLPTRSATLVEVKGDNLLYTPSVAFNGVTLSSGIPPTLTVFPIVDSTNLNEFDWSNAGKITVNMSEGLSTSGDKSVELVLDSKTLAEFSWGKSELVKLQSETQDVALKTTKLSKVEQFYDNSGKFLLDEPQTIKITQGDGKTASVTLYASDTLGDVAKKLNTAIADDLGQAKYVDDDSKFATFVDETVENTSESVAGTLLIRSAISGSKGTLRFSGSEEMINALGLNTIQAATESVYTADVTDAHSGAEIASVKVTGNTLNGVLNQNVDVEFDAMAGVIREWDANSNSYKYNVSEYKSTVHLADNTLTLQMGIGSNESMFLSIGDMRSQALGLNDVLVTDRESAARSLSIIDNAIDKVSTQRAKLGAYANRIEYNLDNMRIAEQNITAANSNIQDTDMAKEMINFTKLQIMLQAGNSMMAQANQTQESVLSLLR